MHLSPRKALHVRTALGLIIGLVAGRSVFAADETPDRPANAAAVAAPAADQSQPLSPEITQLIRGLVLLVVPETFEDTDDWGGEVRIQTGLDVDFDDGRLETRRRWKNVNHGSWTRASGLLVDPVRTFQIQVALLPKEQLAANPAATPASDQKTDTAEARDLGVSRYQLQAKASVHATGQQQQWNYGMMLWSLTADADIDVELDATFQVRQQYAQQDGRPQLQLHPVVETATARVTRFHLRKISHVKGSVAREFGSWFESLIDSRVKKLNQKLPAKINRKLQKEQDHLVLPLWFSGLPAGAAPTPAAR